MPQKKSSRLELNAVAIQLLILAWTFVILYYVRNISLDVQMNVYHVKKLQICTVPSVILHTVRNATNFGIHID